MAAGPQQQQGDNSMSLLWIIIGVCLLIVVIGYFFGIPITNAFLRFKSLELDAIQFVMPGHQANLAAAANVASMPVTSLDAGAFNAVKTVANTVGEYLRYPIIVVLAIFSCLVYFANPATKFKKTYSMKRLLDQEKQNWPQVMPVSKLDLVKEDLNKGPWAMAMNPMQFAKHHNILKVGRKPLVEGQLKKEVSLEAGVDIGKANKVFALQLGAVWQGLDNLNYHTKALFAVFAARAHGDEKGSTGLMEQFSKSASEGQLDFTGVDEVLAKYRDTKLVQRVMSKHAYVLTMMASMVQLSRTHGILPTADFLWLKPIDRPLWFMLNSVGRQTPFTEVSGPFAHWLAEKVMGRKIIVPQIKEASKALDVGVRDIVYIPDEESATEEEGS